MGGSIAEANWGGGTQGVGPNSGADYVNGMDLQSDAATLRRQTQPELDAVLGAFNNSTPVSGEDFDVVAAAGDYNLGRTRRTGASAMGAGPVHDEPGDGTFSGTGLKVDPAKLPRFWTSERFEPRYAPSLGWKELGDYLNPIPRWEGFKEGFSISGVFEGLGQFVSNPIDALERGGQAMQDRTREYFLGGRRGDFPAAGRFERQLLGEQAAGAVVGYGIGQGLGFGLRAFNAMGG